MSLAICFVQMIIVATATEGEKMIALLGRIIDHAGTHSQAFDAGLCALRSRPLVSAPRGVRKFANGYAKAVRGECHGIKLNSRRSTSRSTACPRAGCAIFRAVNPD